LLQGEIVAWEDIVREHRLLGLITVPHLIKAGVVRVLAEQSESGLHLCQYVPNRSAGAESFGATPIPADSGSLHPTLSKDWTDPRRCHR
jgi:hypothetical protein